VFEATFWGLVGGVSLVIGAAIGLWLPVPARVVGLVMGFGAGVLISAVAFELTQEAFDESGGGTVTLGLLAGALTFYGFDRLIDRAGGEERKDPSGTGSGESESGESGAANALVLGALLDGIPESVVIGASLLAGEGVGIPVVVAVFLSNMPESLASATGMQKAGHSKAFVLALWTGVMLIAGLASTLGYVFLDGVSPDTMALIETFAAGAILTMLADTMIPEALEHGGPTVGLMTVVGFAAAFLLTTLE
jgi:ZIP family zinc transporter